MRHSSGWTSWRCSARKGTNVTGEGGRTAREGRAAGHRAPGRTLVILDVKMPKGWTGSTRPSTIGRQAGSPTGRHPDRVSARQWTWSNVPGTAGAMAYLVKPFAKHDLVPAIEARGSARFSELQAPGERRSAGLNERLETRQGHRACQRALLMTKQGPVPSRRRSAGIQAHRDGPGAPP